MTTKSICSLDDARAANPDLGFAVYAYGPGEPVTLEIFTPDTQVYSFTGASEVDVLAQAFPPEAEAPAEPEPNIFD
jgi:hypothetical protein